MNSSPDRRRQARAQARRYLGVLAALVLSLVPVSTLSAQTSLMQSVPATEASVPTPKKLVLTFNGRVVAHLSSALLVGGPSSTRVLLSLPQGPDADTLVYPLPTLAPGQYRVEWKVRAVDGQTTDGTLRFTVIEALR